MVISGNVLSASFSRKSTPTTSTSRYYIAFFPLADGGSFFGVDRRIFFVYVNIYPPTYPPTFFVSGFVSSRPAKTLTNLDNTLSKT